MGKGSPVSEEQCYERSSNTHKRIDELAEKVNKIIGGVIVVGFVMAGIAFYINHRFSEVDKKVQDIHKHLMPAKSK